ncbi:MAG: sensor histidine kinase [Bacteroidetes bacterium]|nr:sensor histidine kinase [Bacteroidota bacterium]
MSKFYSDFSKASVKHKVEITARLNVNELKEVYPTIKDTLEKIKNLSYYKSQNKQARFLFDIIEANLEQGKKNYVKAVFIAEAGLQNRATNIDDSLLCYSILKNSFIRIRNFIRAYEINSKMEALWPRKTDTVEIAYGANKSGIYAGLGFMPEAIKERRNEFAKKNVPHDTDLLVSYYNDIGVYYNRMKNSDSAAGYFLKVQNILDHKKFPASRKKHYEFLKGLSKGNLGLSYFNSGAIEKAVPLIKEDVYYSLQNERYESAFNGYCILVECFIKLNNLVTAKKYIDTTGILMQKHFKDVGPRLNYIWLQSKFYQAAKDYQTANVFFNGYFALKDSISVIEKEQNLLNTEVAFKIETREQELLEKTLILDQKRLNEAAQNTFRAYSFAGIAILLLIIVFLISNNYFSKNRAPALFLTNEKINIQNSQIEQSLKEKEILIKEIHHRVKNNLQIITSMLSLQISKEEGTGSEAILREAKQRIDSIALTHQMLYQKDNLSSILIGEYLQNLVRQIESSLPSSNIRLATELNIENRKINIDSAIPLGLLVNELLTNAYKHAFPNNARGQITVSLKENKDECILVVKDNGVGLPAGYNSPEKKSMGMDLIFILADQLDAQLTIENDNGAHFMLTISKTKLFV